jgi:hypothetical protein
MPDASPRSALLTALVVGNYAVGALGVIATLLALGTPKIEAGLAATLVLGAIAAGLAFASAVGYRQRRRVLGRFVGSAYAGTALLHGLALVILVHAGVGLHTVMTLVYPAVTAVLLHTVLTRELVK